jgi:4-hydroxy-tetrahydrodipicolinate synthase
MVAIDPKLRKALTGISGILVTPFDDQDHVAPKRLKPIIDRAVEAGVHILVANGNTGEFYGLTTTEAETMVHSVAEQIAGRVPMLAGVGRSVKDACALARASHAAGAAALMVHQPPDPFVSPRGVVAMSSGSPKRGVACLSCFICATTASVSTRSSSSVACPAWRA